MSAGNMDSMVNHYSVSKKRRQTDAYTPGGVMGKRPDRAMMVYSNLIRRSTRMCRSSSAVSRRACGVWPIMITGADSLKRSVLLDSGADLISYGMGEHSIVEIADALDAGIAVTGY